MSCSLHVSLHGIEQIPETLSKSSDWKAPVEAALPTASRGSSAIGSVVQNKTTEYRSQDKA